MGGATPRRRLDTDSQGQRDPAIPADGPTVIDAAMIETGQLLAGERGLSGLPNLVALGGRGRPAPAQRGGRAIFVSGATGLDDPAGRRAARRLPTVPCSSGARRLE